MRKNKLRPRPEQVAELTRGQTLPLPPVPESHLQVIAETLVRAWNELAALHATTLCNGDEAEVSALLESRLNALRDEDPCWESLASGVSRGRESTSFDGRHLEKRPDLSIHLTRRNFTFPLVAECKLIDRSHGKTVNLYCTDGLARFVRGEYAWATREAFMLTYVRDGANIADSLLPYLAKSQARTSDPYLTQRLPTPHRSAAADLACSRHSRNFAYVHKVTPASPGEISLWHLWLAAPT